MTVTHLSSDGARNDSDSPQFWRRSVSGARDVDFRALRIIIARSAGSSLVSVFVAVLRPHDSGCSTFIGYHIFGHGPVWRRPLAFLAVRRVRPIKRTRYQFSVYRWHIAAAAASCNAEHRRRIASPSAAALPQRRPEAAGTARDIGGAECQAPCVAACHILHQAQAQAPRGVTEDTNVVRFRNKNGRNLLLCCCRHVFSWDEFVLAWRHTVPIKLGEQPLGNCRHHQGEHNRPIVAPLLGYGAETIYSV